MDHTSQQRYPGQTEQSAGKIESPVDAEILVTAIIMYMYYTCVHEKTQDLKSLEIYTFDPMRYSTHQIQGKIDVYVVRSRFENAFVFQSKRVFSLAEPGFLLKRPGFGC